MFAVRGHEQNRGQPVSRFLRESTQRVEDYGKRLTFDYQLEHTVLRGEQHLGSPAVVDVGSLTVPLDGLALVVAQRHGAKHEPSEASIRAAQAGFDLTWLPFGKQRRPMLKEPRQVLRMDRRLPTPAVPLVQR